MLRPGARSPPSCGCEGLSGPAASPGGREGGGHQGGRGAVKHGRSNPTGGQHRSALSKTMRKVEVYTDAM